MLRRPKHSEFEVVAPEEEEEESYAEYGNKTQAAITAVCDSENSVNPKLTKRPISFHYICSRHNSAPISSVRPLIIGFLFLRLYVRHVT